MARTFLPSLGQPLLVLFCSWAAACTPQRPPEPVVPSTDFASLEKRFPTAHLAEGRTVYLRICVTCHQPDGRGTGNAIPPLVGHVPKLAALPRGKEYLARLGLYGLTGRIEVNGREFFNIMPAQGVILGNVQVAGAMNWAMTQWGNDGHVQASQMLSPDDVAVQRLTRRSAADNLALRAELWPTTP